MTNYSTLDIRTIDEFQDLLNRRDRQRDSQPNSEIELVVNGIINRVRTIGDRALIEFTHWFDGVELTESEMRVSKAEIENAKNSITAEQIDALEEVSSRLRKVSEMILAKMVFSLEIDGTIIKSTLRPLDEIGCYVPGGEAAYPSSLLMCVVPALVAGVRRIVICTPPKPEGIHPLTLAAAEICGIDEIYQIGGAQAIAALAYGTKAIKPVQKIVGPGNAYVAKAKQTVSRDVLIDSPAGPSELLVIADENANARNIALDMISQAEHSQNAVSILLSPSRRLCNRVTMELARLVPDAPRSEVIEESIRSKGGVFYCDSMNKCIQLANRLAPEHIQILTNNPAEIASRITTAGLVLLGEYTPVAASDYCLGTNHVLPTGGYASTFSGLSVLDYLRLVHVVESNSESLQRIAKTIKILTEAEKLPNHGRAIAWRFTE